MGVREVRRTNRLWLIASGGVVFASRHHKKFIAITGARYYSCGFSLIDGDQEDHVIAKLNYCPAIGLVQTCYEEYLELGKDDIYGFAPPKKRLDRRILEEEMLAPPLKGYTWSPVLLLDYRKFHGVNVWIGLSSLGYKHADNGYLHILRRSSMKEGQENLLYQVLFPDQQIGLCWGKG